MSSFSPICLFEVFDFESAVNTMKHSAMAAKLNANYLGNTYDVWSSKLVLVIVDVLYACLKHFKFRRTKRYINIAIELSDWLCYQCKASLIRGVRFRNPIKISNKQTLF